MEAVATITTYAAVTCVVAFIGIIWRHDEDWLPPARDFT
jgi:hypothetical protein